VELWRPADKAHHGHNGPSLRWDDDGVGMMTLGGKLPFILPVPKEWGGGSDAVADGGVMAQEPLHHFGCAEAVPLPNCAGAEMERFCDAALAGIPGHPLDWRASYPAQAIKKN
jgi:hypothetical protein